MIANMVMVRTTANKIKQIIMKILSVFCLVALFFLIRNVKAQTVSSPDQKIKVSFQLVHNQPIYKIFYQGKEVLGASALGLQENGIDFHRHLNLLKASNITSIEDNYTLHNAKKSHIHYKANQRSFNLRNPQNKKISIIFNVSNDGVAFRYFLPEHQENLLISKEYTSFSFKPETSGFLQHKAKAQSGWCHTNPSYEENYQQNIPVGTFSKTGWVYPALFHYQNIWMLITEANMDGTYCGTHLMNDSLSTDYKIAFPEPVEVFTNQGYLPKDVTYSPWRIITIGSLKTIAESTLGTDLAAAAKVNIDPKFIKPGKSSWSWIMSKDDSITYTEQIRYIDFAAKMKWQYCLIDADWDTKIGYDKIKLLADYAAKKNVGLNLWYNSSGDWNTTVYHPKSRLLTHQQREKEFARLSEMGIKGIKVDFFNGDGQSMIAYYIGILNDAAKYHLLVNFHGATLPRGWARTYPNLMTTEAVKGYEMITFGQEAANQEANHCAMLPFTRNVFDPMDFTPMNLYKIPTNVHRQTTSGFELATSVLFLSGIQHYAESPEGMSHVPTFVQHFLSVLPNYWDDVKFIDGFPGKYVVIARKSGDKWYLAGINGENSPKTIQLDLTAFHKRHLQLITDGDKALSFQQKNINPQKNYTLSMKGEGGFVMVLE